MTSVSRLFALLLASMFLFTTSVACAGSHLHHQPPPRSISVTGHGKVSVAPDEARISMMVRKTSKNLQEAEKKVDAIVRSYVAKAGALGIDNKDLSTAGYRVQPQYDYGKQGRSFRGYQVTRNIRLTVRRISKTGDYLQAATAAGVNEVSSVQLQASQASKYRLQALSKAAKNARAQARTLANALGMKLGPARHVSVAGNAPEPRPIMMRAMTASAKASSNSGNKTMGLSAGLIDYEAKVEIDFDVSS